MLSSTTKRGRIGLVIGLLVAGLGIAGTIVLRTSGSSTGTGTGNGVATVVAKSDIAAGTQLTKDLLDVTSLPPSAVPVGALTDPGQAIGKYALQTIPARQLILPSLITDISGATVAPGAVAPGIGSSFALKSGDVAMAMPVDPQIAVGYYIQPGDRVDFIISVPTDASTVKYGFQDVLVLRVGGNSGTGAAAATRQDSLIVVELPRRQAEQLTVMVSKGSPMQVVRLVLRPRDQYGKGYLDSGSDQPFSTTPNDAAVGPNQLNALFH